MISRASSNQSNIDFAPHSSYGRVRNFRKPRRLGTRGLIAAMLIFAAVMFVALGLGYFDWVYELFR